MKLIIILKMLQFPELIQYQRSMSANCITVTYFIMIRRFNRIIWRHHPSLTINVLILQSSHLLLKRKSKKKDIRKIKWFVEV